MINEPLSPVALRLLGLLKRCALLVRRPRLQAVHFQPPDNRPAPSLLYLGEGESLDYLATGLLPDWSATPLPPLGITSLRQTIDRWRTADTVVLAEVNRLLAHLLPHDGWRSYPWIRQIAHLEHPDWHRQAARNLAKYQAAIARQGYTFSTTRDPAAVERFHQHVYRPYVHYRYGTACRARTGAEFQRWIQAGFLLEVGWHGQTVAGGICWRQGSRLATCAWGVAPDFAAHLQRGALGAAYHHIFANLAPRDGITTVDLVRSRAHAADGVYRHKTAWGATAHADPWPHVLWSIHLPPDGQFPAELGPQLVRVGNHFQRLANLPGPPPGAA